MIINMVTKAMVLSFIYDATNCLVFKKKKVYFPVFANQDDDDKATYLKTNDSGNEDSSDEHQ